MEGAIKVFLSHLANCFEDLGIKSCKLKPVLPILTYVFKFLSLHLQNDLLGNPEIPYLPPLIVREEK